MPPLSACGRLRRGACAARHRAGSAATRAAGPRSHGLASSLGEKYVNECDLFGCHTVLVRPQRPLAAPAPHPVQRLASVMRHAAPVDARVEARLESAKARLGEMEGSLAAENETAMEAYSSTAALESEMHQIEKQTHLDRVEIRAQHAALAKDDEILAEERQRAGAAQHGERVEARRLAHAQQVARAESAELATARTRLRKSQALEAKAVAEARGYRDALDRATQKLVAYKQKVGSQELKLQREVAHDEAVAQKQMMQEEQASSSAQMSDKEVIDRLTEEVRRLTKELKQREIVIQLQQKVIKVQAHEVHTLEKTAAKEADAAAQTMNNVMESAEAASVGQTVKNQEEEERENAEIEAAHPGIDPSSIPSVFAEPKKEEATMPAADDWKSFGDDAIAKNPHNEAPVVGENGVVDGPNFAAGVKGAHGTKSPAEAEAEEKAVQKANAAITAFEKEEEHQNEAMAEFTSSHASPERQAQMAQSQSEENFAKHPVVHVDPAIKTLDDFIAKSEEERQKTWVEEQNRAVERKVHEKELARTSREADRMVASITEKPKDLVRGMLHHTAAKAIAKNATTAPSAASTVGEIASAIGGALNPLNPSSPFAPKKLVHPERALNDLEGEVQDFPSHMPALKPLSTSAQMGGIEDADDSTVQAGTKRAQLHTKVPQETDENKIRGEAKWWGVGDDKLHKDKSSFLFQGNVAKKASRAAAAGSVARSETSALHMKKTVNPQQSGASAAAMAEKAADIASFIVAHPPAAEARGAGADHHAAYKPDVVSLTPQKAVLPPLPPASKDAVGQHKPKHVLHKTLAVSLEPQEAALPPMKAPPAPHGKAVSNPTQLAAAPADKARKDGSTQSAAARVHSTAETKASAPTAVTPVANAAAQPKDTIRDDLSRAAKQLESYDFLHEQQLTLADAVPTKESATQVARDRSVQQQMKALEKSERKARPPWESSGLKVKAGRGGAREQNLVELPADMRGGMHIGARFASDAKERQVSFDDNNRGAPLHAKATPWRITKAQQAVKQALLREEEAARERVAAAKRTEAAEQKAAALAQEELRRFRASEARVVVRTAHDTARLLDSPPDASNALQHAHSVSRPNNAHFGDDDSLGAAVERARAATNAAESAMAVKIPTIDTVASLGLHKRAAPALPARAQAHTVSPAVVASDLNWPRTDAEGVEDKGMRADERRLQKEVGGPISSSVAKGIVHDLAKLNALVGTLKARPHTTPLFGSTQFAQHDASMDAKAAGA